MKNLHYLKIFVIILFCFLLTKTKELYSQEYDYNDYEIKNPRYGFGIGFNPFYILHDFSDVNQKLSISGYNKLSKDNIISYGGSFYIYTGFVQNLRVGGFWSQADKNSSKKDNNLIKDFDYNFSFWAVNVDYALPLAKRLSLVFGSFFGKGTQNYDISEKYNNDIDWEELWNSSSRVIDNKTNLNSSFFIFSPYVLLEYALLDFLMIRIGGGYIGSAKTDLNYENFYPVKNVPSSLRINDFYFQFGILTGLFME